jgi:Family of unknown function (DUF6491)
MNRKALLPFMIVPLLWGCESSMSPRADAGPGRACFDPDDVRNFDVQRDGTLRVQTFRNGDYIAELTSICPDLSSAQKVGFVPSGGFKLCGKTAARVVVGAPGRGAQECRIGAIDRAPPTASAAANQN